MTHEMYDDSITIDFVANANNNYCIKIIEESV